jgi:hypothetical protein
MRKIGATASVGRLGRLGADDLYPTSHDSGADCGLPPADRTPKPGDRRLSTVRHARPKPSRPMSSPISRNRHRGAQSRLRAADAVVMRPHGRIPLSAEPSRCTRSHDPIEGELAIQLREKVHVDDPTGSEAELNFVVTNTLIVEDIRAFIGRASRQTQALQSRRPPPFLK